MNHKLTVLLTGLLVATALLVGCSGGGGEVSDEAAIRQVVSDFGKAFNDGDAGKLIGLLDSESKKHCKESEIAPLLALVKSFSGGMKFTAEASDIKVNGDKATAMIVAAIGAEKQSPEEQALVKEGGKWKLYFTGEECDLA